MGEVCVRVAVRIRPLLPKEVLHNHQVCVRVVPGSAQVMLGSDRTFCFDHAFGSTVSQDEVYESCVLPLVESLIGGYNATVFCYGQTGSGKTYTLGGGNLAEDGGIIDRVAHDVFELLGKATQSSDVEKATVRVSYMELYREELRDLLELHTTHKELHIREDDRGNTVVVGAKEVTVSSAEELLSVLEMGNALRHTGTTGMNEKSSRSHAILTMQLFQCFHDNTSFLKSVRSSKLCLVDLAGSERAGKTGNTGIRLKESVYINTGLLALGNVIRALSDPGRNRRGNNSNSAHIPYRDAKITRLLRDALGGTAHTLMVACVSPSHHSVAETLSVLQFASKARHIRNCPGTASTHTEVRSCPPTWDPSDARLGELEYEAQTLRELLIEKEKELQKEREKTKGGVGEEDNFKQPNQVNWLINHHATANQEELSDYCLLAQEAAVLLGDISGSAQNKDFRQRLQDWQERLKAVNNSHQSNNKEYSEKEGDQPIHVTILKLRQELSECQEALAIDEQVLQQKDTELRHLQKEVDKLIQENKTHIQALKEEKQHNHIKTEQLVNHQMLIDRLRSELMTLKNTLGKMETGASGDSEKRPHSVPVFRQSCGQRPPRKIHSSPPAYSLERIIAAFKMRGQVLLAEIDEEDEVSCPFLKQQVENQDNNQEEEEQDDDDMDEVGFRRSLNRTWTSEQRKSFQTKASTRWDETSNGIWSKQQSHGVTGNKDDIAKPCDVSKAKMRSDTVTQRRIQELSVNMRMKEELIKELEKTDKESQAVDRRGSQNTDGRAAGLLAEISLQSQRVRAELYRSLQHMRLQRAELQDSLRQERDASHNTLLDQQEGQKLENKGCHQEELREKVHEGRWLEEEEEQVLQRRAQLQELEEELRRREEVLLQKEAYMQQKNKLEMKKLRSSQVLSQDLLRVSLQLETLQQQMQSSSSSSSSEKPNRGFTVEELERERDKLKKRRDTLDAQLKDNKVLTVEEEHYLLQLEEALETLDAALDFKTRSIQDKQDKLSITESSPRQLENTEPAHVCNIIRKLKELSPPEVSELFVKYFNKVVCLREEERSLRLQCEELVLHNGEQEVVLREMEAAMQRLALDADRRLTEQHRDHQKHIQLLLQKLKENATAEKHEVIQDRLQHLEKELFFYKTSSRQLKKKLRELLSDAHQPANQPSGTQEHSHTFSIPACPSTNEPQMRTEEAQTKTHITTTHTKIHSGPTDKKAHNEAEIKHTHAHQNPRPSSSSDLPTHKKTTVPSHDQMHTQSYGAAQCGEKLEMTQVRLLLKNLRQISPSDLQVRGSATRRRQSVVDTSTETILEDSIEMSKNTDK